MRRICIALIAVAAAFVAQGYLGRDGATLAGERARARAAGEEGAGCRPYGAPGSRAYVDCRRALAEAHEQQKAIIQEQKRRDFDRLLGEGTGGFDETF
jgi:hypothetical protein